MEQIELVIKMPKKVHDAIIKSDVEVVFGWSADVFGDSNIGINQYIRTGKVLPKGHGRLKDFDKIEWFGCDFEGKDCIEAKGDCSVFNLANCYAKQVRELPTIIEADKEEAE